VQGPQARLPQLHPQRPLPLGNMSPTIAVLRHSEQQIIP
jgi:hypothetical protein